MIHPYPSTENIQLALNKKIPYLEINYGDSLAQVLEHGPKCSPGHSINLWHIPKTRRHSQALHQ